LAVGSEIILKIAGKEEPWTIVGVYQNLGVRVWYESYASYDYVSRLIGDVHKTRQVQIVAAHHDPAFQAEMANRIERHFRDRGLACFQHRNQQRYAHVLSDQFDIIVSVLLVMAMLITLVGGLGLAGTMSMSVMERTREIGVMRAVGASDRSVLRVVLVEGALMAVFSWLAAIFFAVPVAKLMSMTIGTELANGPLSFVYSYQGAALWLLVVLLVAFTASYLPARSASRLTVRDVLAYE
jgi:putative ABC transport system permease protein